MINIFGTHKNIDGLKRETVFFKEGFLGRSIGYDSDKFACRTCVYGKAILNFNDCRLSAHLTIMQGNEDRLIAFVRYTSL